MIRRCYAGLMVLPVLLAAWLTFAASPVTGLPLSELAIYDLPEEETTQVAEADPAIPTDVE